MELRLFGTATPTGEALRQHTANSDLLWILHAYSRRSATASADFSNPSAFRPAGNPGVTVLWISFGPIWLLAPFLEQLTREHPERLAGMLGLITLSPSSAITKRFAANRSDREIVAHLSGAEDLLVPPAAMLVPAC